MNRTRYPAGYLNQGWLPDRNVPYSYEWEGYDGYLETSGKVSLFVGVGIVYEIEELLRMIFEPDTNSFEVIRIGLSGFNLDYEDILDYFYSGIKSMENFGYPDIEEEYDITDDSSLFYDDFEIPSPFEAPPIELEIDSEDAHYALWIGKTPIGNLVQDNNGDMVFYYETREQLDDAIRVYDPIAHLIERRENAILVKSFPGAVSSVDTSDPQDFGDWVVDETLTDELLLKI